MRGPADRGAPPLEVLVANTIGHYNTNSLSFWEGTKDHDVDQNRRALLDAIPPPEDGRALTILDVGCGPGRDILYFQSLGHEVVGLDGAAEFVRMAREKTGAEVLLQDFHQLDLPKGRFDGAFCNASLFHVERGELPGVLQRLRRALRPGGVLFASNPRGNDEESFEGRYGNYMSYETWARVMGQAGFVELGHYYRPPGLPRHQQPWLASTWAKKADGDDRG